MELYIQIKNGIPFEHPIFGDNFRQAFPDIDVDNLPADFARFERIPAPSIGVYEVNDGVTYEWDNGVVKDVWHIRPMTDDERTAKQNKVKETWATVGFGSWIFNEVTCSFDPPVPMPNDGKRYEWNEDNQNWVEVNNV